LFSNRNYFITLFVFSGGETIVPDPKEKMKYFRNQFKENGTNEK
jgi:hypothetical protein